MKAWKILCLSLGLALTSSAVGAQQRGVSDSEIIIGSVQPLSGPVASWGVPISNGLRMAVDDVNAAGGVNGRKLRLIVEDDQYDPRRSLQAARKLIDHDKAFAFVYNFGTAQNLALGKIFEENGVMLVFPSTGDPRVWTPRSDYRFGYLFPNEEQGRLMIRMLAEKNKMKVGIIYQDDDLGKSYLLGIVDEAKKRGVVLESHGIQRGAIDTSSQMARLKAADVQAIIVASVIPPAVSIAKDRVKMGWNVDVLLAQSAYSDSVINLAGAAADGLFAVSQVQIPYPDISPELKVWNDRYRERFGQAADLGSLYGYQTMLMFVDAAKRAGRNLTAETLAASLKKMKDYTDLFQSVPYSVDEKDHLATHGVFLFQVKDGKWVKASKYIPL